MIVWQGKKAEKELKGVYGIYARDRLLYIGSTRRSFEKRLKEHNKKIEQKDNNFLYITLARTKEPLFMKPLIIFQYLRTSQDITKEAQG